MDQRGWPGGSACRSVRVSFAVFGRSPWLVAGYLGSVDCYTDCCRLTWPPPLTSLVIYTRAYVHSCFGSGICISSVMLLATFSILRSCYFLPCILILAWYQMLWRNMCSSGMPFSARASLLVSRAPFRLEHFLPFLGAVSLPACLPSCTRHLYSAHT